MKTFKQFVAEGEIVDLGAYRKAKSKEAFDRGIKGAQQIADGLYNDSNKFSNMADYHIQNPNDTQVPRIRHHVEVRDPDTDVSEFYKDMEFLGYKAQPGGTHVGPSFEKEISPEHAAEILSEPNGPFGKHSKSINPSGESDWDEDGIHHYIMVTGHDPGTLPHHGVAKLRSYPVETEEHVRDVKRMGQILRDWGL